MSEATGARVPGTDTEEDSEEEKWRVPGSHRSGRDLGTLGPSDCQRWSRCRESFSRGFSHTNPRSVAPNSVGGRGQGNRYLCPVPIVLRSVRVLSTGRLQGTRQYPRPTCDTGTQGVNLPH